MVLTQQGQMSIGKQQTRHWARIRTAFSDRNCFPKTFFVGAAIEAAMAQEIYQQLEDQTLSSVANLTNETQVVSLCDWLIKI